MGLSTKDTKGTKGERAVVGLWSGIGYVVLCSWALDSLYLGFGMGQWKDPGQTDFGGCV